MIRWNKNGCYNVGFHSLELMRTDDLTGYFIKVSYRKLFIDESPVFYKNCDLDNEKKAKRWARKWLEDVCFGISEVLDWSMGR